MELAEIYGIPITSPAIIKDFYGFIRYFEVYLLRHNMDYKKALIDFSEIKKIGKVVFSVDEVLFLSEIARWFNVEIIVTEKLTYIYSVEDLLCLDTLKYLANL